MVSLFLHFTKFANSLRTMLSGGPRLIQRRQHEVFQAHTARLLMLNAVRILVILIESTRLTFGLTLPLLELISEQRRFFQIGMDCSIRAMIVAISTDTYICLFCPILTLFACPAVRRNVEFLSRSRQHDKYIIAFLHANNNILDGPGLMKLLMEAQKEERSLVLKKILSS